MDLARKLLSYDPSQRLTATQALAHPFLHDVEYLLEGRGAPPQHDAVKAWQVTMTFSTPTHSPPTPTVPRPLPPAPTPNLPATPPVAPGLRHSSQAQMHAAFEQHLARRNALLVERLPALEQHLHAEEGKALRDEAAMTSLLGRQLSEVDSRVLAELRQVVRSALQQPSNGGVANCDEGGGGNGVAKGGLQAAQLQAALAQLSHESGDASAARLREQAAEAREQTERLRAELGALQAQLSAHGVDGSGANNCTDATTDAEGRAVQPPSAGRRAPAVRIAAEDAQGTASPVNLARQSMVGCGEANPGPSGRPRDRMHGMTTLAGE